MSKETQRVTLPWASARVAAVLAANGAEIERNAHVVRVEHEIEDTPAHRARYQPYYDVDAAAGTLRVRDLVKSEYKGTLRVAVSVGQQVVRGDLLFSVEEACGHSIQFSGMCGMCGQDLRLDDAADGGTNASRARYSMVHDTMGIRVSQDRARELDKETSQRLLREKKLSLILDLDQTLIHATADAAVGVWLDQERARKAAAAEAATAQPAVSFMGPGQAHHLHPNAAAHGSASAHPNGEGGDPSAPTEAAAAAANEHPPPNTLSSAAGASAPTQNHPPSSPSRGAITASGAPDVFRFRLADDPHEYFLRLRPYLKDFLAGAAEQFELHIYTMGSRMYANQVARIIDPRGKYFKDRILSRDESGSFQKKSLERLFPCDQSMVVVIDDRGDVWCWADNLIRVHPYSYFLRTGDINAPIGVRDAPPLPGLPDLTVPAPPAPGGATAGTTAPDSAPGAPPLAQPSAQTHHQQQQQQQQQQPHPSGPPLASHPPGGHPQQPPQLQQRRSVPCPVRTNDDDKELKILLTKLRELHAAFFVGPEPDVRVILPKMKRQVLAGCEIVFSGVIPKHIPESESDPWKLATSFGARCSPEVTPSTTHVVATRWGTHKTKRARAQGTELVNPSWLLTSIAYWKRQEEARFHLICDEDEDDDDDDDDDDAPVASNGGDEDEAEGSGGNGNGNGNSSTDKAPPRDIAEGEGGAQGDGEEGANDDEEEAERLELQRELARLGETQMELGDDDLQADQLEEEFLAWMGDEPIEEDDADDRDDGSGAGSGSGVGESAFTGSRSGSIHDSAATRGRDAATPSSSMTGTEGLVGGSLHGNRAADGDLELNDADSEVNLDSAPSSAVPSPVPRPPKRRRSVDEGGESGDLAAMGSSWASGDASELVDASAGGVFKRARTDTSDALSQASQDDSLFDLAHDLEAELDDESDSEADRP